MRPFIKAQATSLLASVTDFFITIIGVSLWQSGYLPAMAGAVGGGLVSFAVARTWAFTAANQPIGGQFGRFVLVWLGNALLNVGGLFLAVEALGVPYLPAKAGVAVLVGVTYNYFFQKDFVFSVS